MSSADVDMPTGTLSSRDDLHAQISHFLAREARLLDEGREEEWYELLDDNILYTIPIRQSTEPRSMEINRSAFRLRDTKAHIRTRLDRLHTGMAYSEVPPSRTMRLVGSIEITGTPEVDLVDVTSALLVYRQRGIDPHFDLIPCRRNDRLRLISDGVRLLTREVILTETVLATPNLAVIL
jgi:3-phenylpropionate/cinnamic acid dioxygenase small subunit